MKNSLSTIVVALSLSACTPKFPTPIDAIDIAQCLKNKGAKLYGAWYCHACDDIKEQFGEAWAILENNYVECAMPNGEITSTCEAKGITTYPTWQINGKKYKRNRTLQHIAELSECKY